MNTRTLTISGISSYSYRREPYIRLQGKWLRQLGFEIGGKIQIEGKEGLIVIHVAAADESKGVQQK